MAQQLISGLGLSPGSSILDIGTGTGGMIPVLGRFGQLTVYEPDPATLELTRSTYERDLPDVTFLSGERLDVDGARYSLITAFDVLEHCQDDRSTLEDWSNLLEDQGYLLITVPAFPFLWGKNDELSHHYRRYTRASLSDVMHKVGFSVRKLSYTNLAAFAPVWVSRNIKEKLENLAGIQRDEPWDFDLPPAPVNALLYGSVSWEAAWLERGSLPLGTSLICLAQKSPGKTTAAGAR